MAMRGQNREPLEDGVRSEIASAWCGSESLFAFDPSPLWRGRRPSDLSRRFAPSPQAIGHSDSFGTPKTCLYESPLLK